MAPLVRCASPQLEHLAQQHEGDDDRGRLEVAPDLAVVPAEGGREDAGHEDGGQAVEPGDAGADADEGEHVQAAGAEAQPHPLKEGPAPPQHDGGRQQELDPTERDGRERAVDHGRGQHRRHREEKQGDGEHQGDAETPRHVLELRVPIAGEGGVARLEGHATDPAGPGLRLDDFGVHRAHVLDGLCGLRRGRGGQGGGDGHRGPRGACPQPVLRVLGEAFAAARVAEPIRASAVLVRAAPRGRGIDLHPAHRVRLEPDRARTPQGDLHLVAHGSPVSPRNAPPRRGARSTFAFWSAGSPLRMAWASMVSVSSPDASTGVSY